MPLSHFLLALAVVAIWGSNFVVIKVALEHLPPLLFAALRFTIAFVPAAFFLPRPAVRLANLAGYGVLIGVGQFGLLYIAMGSQITPGLASLVVQTQIFFTIGLSMWLTGERVVLTQWLALAMAVLGLVWIVIHTDASTTPLGLMMVIMAAMSWAGGNTLSRAAGSINMLSYVVWSSIFAVPPLMVLSMVFEGWPAIATGLANAELPTWAAVVWQSVGNTLFGYAAWAWLLSRHPSATVAPLALLIPIFGMGASAWLLGEPLPNWKLQAAGFVIGGLVLNLWATYRRRKSA
jgi:O-acetylserine/cysteine efflux transporter